MKFKKDIEPMETDNVYYDLFDGGYIDFEEYIEDSEMVDQLNKARELIMDFISSAIDTGSIKIY